MNGSWCEWKFGVGFESMGLEGLEPSWVLPRRILSPLRLPIPPQALVVVLMKRSILSDVDG